MKLVFIIIGIVLFYNFYKRKYDISDSFNSVKINSENDLNNYLGYIKTYKYRAYVLLYNIYTILSHFTLYTPYSNHFTQNIPALRC